MSDIHDPTNHRVAPEARHNLLVQDVVYRDSKGDTITRDAALRSLKVIEQEYPEVLDPSGISRAEILGRAIEERQATGVPTSLREALDAALAEEQTTLDEAVSPATKTSGKEQPKEVGHTPARSRRAEIITHAGTVANAGITQPPQMVTLPDGTRVERTEPDSAWLKRLLDGEAAARAKKDES